MSENITSIKTLEPNEAGIYTLDREAKVMLLQLLRDGTYTRNDAERLARKLDINGLIIFGQYEECKIPESAICNSGFKALEAKCRTCNLIAGCFYWREYGKAFTFDADIIAMLKTSAQDGK